MVGPRTVEQLLQSLLDRYSDYPIYRDIGRVETIYTDNQGRPKGVTRTLSNTTFIRDRGLRIEVQDCNKASCPTHAVVTWFGGESRLWSHLNPDWRVEASLELAIATAVGLSNGVALYVPSLLLPDLIASQPIRTLTNLVRLDDEQMDGQVCCRLMGEWKQAANTSQDVIQMDTHEVDITPSYRQYQSDPVVLWIDGQANLLRGIDLGCKYPDLHITTTIRYSPNCPSVISDDVFIL